MTYGAIISAVVSVGTAAYGAYSSNKAAKKAKSAADAANATTAEQIAAQQQNLQGLYDEQSVPFDVFKEIFTAYPGLLDQVLPDFRRQSIESANQFTTANVSNFKSTVNSLFPDYEKQAARRVSLLNEQDPANLGQEEIKAVTRKLSPLIPEGTLNPNNGSVAGGTTSPVSLYRNLVSGLYQQRRDQFDAKNNQFLADAENSAARQQVKSESFLPMFLSAANQAASGLTTATLGQEQQQIAGSQSYLNALLGVGTAPDNSAAYDARTSQAITQGVQALGSAYATYANNNKSSGSSNPYSYSGSGQTASYPSGYSGATGSQSTYYTGGSGSI